MSLSRREMLGTVPLAAVAGLNTQEAMAMNPADNGAREPLIVRMHEPRSLETPLSGLFNGGTERFFVRSHFPVPVIDARTFKLTVEGHVENKLELTLDDLRKMRTLTLELLMECAGNGRVFLVPQAKGLLWGHGGVGQAKWTGVPLSAILERAKVKAGAVDVILVGADKGNVGDPASPGPIHFDRSLPLEKAKKDEAMIAWEMNEEPLTPAHGAPLRAVIGGWYGMASVKWLTKIVVTDRPHTGFWQTLDYSYWKRDDAGLPQLTPVSVIQPKAVITSPIAGAVLPKARQFTITGYAWAGENSVAKVEVSLDGGENWSEAVLGKAERFKQTRWELTVFPPALDKMPVKLLARCTDSQGNTQPTTRDADRRTYMINHTIPVEVTVM